MASFLSGWDSPPPVASLLASRGPAAVSGLIALIVVDPVECQAVRPLAHVGKEVRERVTPPVANADPAPPVVGVARCFRVRASLHHADPSLVCRGAEHAVCGLNQGRASARGFATQAATRARAPLAQLLGSHRNKFATLAGALPTRIAIRRSLRRAQHGKATKRLIRQINADHSYPQGS